MQSLPPTPPQAPVWCTDVQFLCYVPPQVTSTGEVTPDWIEALDIMNNDLRWLLLQSHQRFWCQVCVCAFLVPFLVLISSGGSVHGVDMAGILFPFPISSTVPTQFSLRSIQTYLWGRYLYMYVCSLCCIFVSRNHNNKCQRQSFQICSNAAAQAIFAALLRGACFDVDTTMEPL